MRKWNGVLGAAVLAPLISLSADAATVTGLDFKGTGDPSVLEIRTDSPVQFEKRENSEDRQLVIDLPGARLNSTTKRRIDTSSFDSNVIMVSPYAVDGQDAARIVVQLKKASTADVTQDGNKIRVSFPKNAVAPSGSSAAPAPTAGDGGSQAASSGGTPAVPTGPMQVEESDSSGTGKLRSFVENQEKKVFSGKPITLQVRDMEAGDVFRMIGEASGFNIVLADDVKGKVTLSLIDVPWDQALNVVLQSLQLGAERNNNILRITTLRNLTTEKMNEIRAAQASRAAAPRLTRIFPISYATLDDIAKVVEKLQTTFQGADAGGSGLTNVGNAIVVDKRTNSLIIRDTPENLERIEKLVTILDTQTPQVNIESKVVEAQEGTTFGLGGSAIMGGVGGTTGGIAFGMPAEPSSMLSTLGVTSAPASGSTGALGISFIPAGAHVTAMLNALESENKAKIVSSPKTVVLNKESATVTQTFPQTVAVDTVNNGVTVRTFNILEGKIELKVIPQVAVDGSVRMDLELTRDVVADAGNKQFAIGHRTMKTNVLVESGSTLVIGGIHISDEGDSDSGIPILRNLPLIGTFFNSKAKHETRNELLFFVTPTIINPKKAGFAG